MEPMKISVGRTIHYNTDDSLPARKVAAIVTQVSLTEEGVVDLFVIEAQSISFIHNVKKGNERGQWNWPERV